MPSRDEPERCRGRSQANEPPSDHPGTDDSLLGDVSAVVEALRRRSAFLRAQTRTLREEWSRLRAAMLATDRAHREPAAERTNAQDAGAVARPADFMAVMFVVSVADLPHLAEIVSGLPREFP